MMFVTVFCGILNFRTGQLQYSNAGHEPPLVLREAKPALAGAAGWLCPWVERIHVTGPSKYCFNRGYAADLHRRRD